jgi:hypothetical protein
MNPLTNLEANQLVYNWYKKLDVHAPVEEVLPLLMSEGLEMRFPEGTLRTLEDFKGWYSKVTNLFFDEVHDMKMLNIELDGETATVKLVVNWQARIWVPPSAKSKWLGFDAHQTWIVKRDKKTGKAVVATYIVDFLDPMEGSAPL